MTTSLVIFLVDKAFHIIGCHLYFFYFFLLDVFIFLYLVEDFPIKSNAFLYLYTSSWYSFDTFFLFVLSANYMVRLNCVIDLSWRPRFLFTKWNQPTWLSTVRPCQAPRNESTPWHVRGTSKSWFIKHPCRICQLILHNQTLIAALPHPFLSVLNPEMHT